MSTLVFYNLLYPCLHELFKNINTFDMFMNTRYIYVSCFHLYTKCFVTDIFDAHMSTRGVLKQIYLIMFMFTLGVFQWGSVTRSLVLCVCFVDRCLSFCTFSIGHCVVCPSIYGFWLPLWYLQIFLRTYNNMYDVFMYIWHVL